MNNGFGIKLRELRKKKGLQVKEVAYEICVHPSCLCSIELGRRRPSDLTAENIAKYYGLHIIKTKLRFGIIPEEIKDLISSDPEKWLNIFKEQGLKVGEVK